MSRNAHQMRPYSSYVSPLQLSSSSHLGLPDPQAQVTGYSVAGSLPAIATLAGMVSTFLLETSQMSCAETVCWTIVHAVVDAVEDDVVLGYVLAVVVGDAVVDAVVAFEAACTEAMLQRLVARVDSKTAGSAAGASTVKEPSAATLAAASITRVGWMDEQRIGGAPAGLDVRLTLTGMTLRGRRLRSPEQTGGKAQRCSEVLRTPDYSRSQMGLAAKVSR